MAKHQFYLLWEGASDNGKDWRAGMQLTGAVNPIGKLLADFAVNEMLNGHREPMKVLDDCFRQLQKNVSGFGTDKKIIIP